MFNLKITSFSARAIIFIGILALGKASKSSILGDRAIGAGCTTNEECSGHPETGAYCELNSGIGICWCTQGYVVVRNDTGQFCGPIQNEIHAECIDRTQCQRGSLGKFSDCLESETEPGRRVCDCLDFATYQPGPGPHTCHVKANHTRDSCTVSNQCEVNLGGKLSTCQEGICACTNASVERPDGSLCLPVRDKIGEQCELDDQCTGGVLGELSLCDPYSKICRCIDGSNRNSEDGGCVKKEPGEGSSDVGSGNGKTNVNVNLVAKVIIISKGDEEPKVIATLE